MISIGAPYVVASAVGKTFPAGRSWRGIFGPKLPRRSALHDVNLEVRRGELLGLLGPNGAGKTTLLKMLATLLLPDSGKISIDGIDVVRRPIAAKRLIGVSTSEERSFYFRLTARDNLRFFGALVGLHGAALAQRIEEVASIVNLTTALDKRFETYSSGMRQRLTIARALLGDPELLICDEPTRAVDPVNAEDIRNLIRNELVLRRGKTVVYATNLVDEAWSICDRIAVVNRGTIVAVDAPRSLSAGLDACIEYCLTFDDLPPLLLAAVDAMPEVGRIRVTSAEGRCELSVGLHAREASLDKLMRTVTAHATLRAIRHVEPRPFDVFRHVTDGDSR